MKNELKISTLAIVCVLCTALSSAYGASSVRSLGGTGTYSSASSASAASSSSTAAARSGSVRVTPTTGVSGSSATNTSSTNSRRVTTTPRLSIGKYLGGSTSVSTGSSLRPQTPSGGSSSGGDGSMDPEVAANLQKAVEDLQDNIVDLKDADDEIKGLLEEKQNALIPTDDYITIENDEIFVNVDNLKEALAGATGEDGREIELDKVGDYLVWRYVGDSSWNNLIAIADITGPRGPQGEKGEPGDPANLTDYPTKTDMEDAISAAVDNLAATYATKEELADYVKTETANATYATKDELSGKLDSDALAGYATTVGVQTAIREATDGLATSAELTTGLAGKANVADVYTKSEVYNKTEVNDLVADVAAGDMQEALKDYAKTSDVEAGLAEKADKTALDSKADATVVDALSSKVDTIGVAADNAGLAATAAAETAGAAKTTAEAAQAIANAVSGEVETVKTTADTAKTTADAAKTAADEAKELASGASDAAQAAQDTATAAQDKADAAALAVASKADKATTLAGYGITDAYTKTEVDSKVEGLATDADLTELEGKVQTNTSNIGALKNTVGEGALTTTAQNLVGAVNELKTKTDGMATDGNFEEMNNKITQMEQTVNTAVGAIEGKADTTYVDEQLATKANTADLGTLATKSKITNDDVADDAAIARTKLAEDVQASLDKADAAISMVGAGTDAVLGVDSNGDKVWYEIAF